MKRKACVFCWLVICFLMIGEVDSYADVTGRSQVIGTLSQAPESITDADPTIEENELGDLVADAVKNQTGADIALINGGDFINSLGSGEVTYGELLDLFTENYELGLATMTPKELKAVLELSVSQLQVDTDTERIDTQNSKSEGFLQISGLLVKYDASAPVGERVLKMTLTDGTELDLEDTTTNLNVAATAYMLSGGYGYDTVSFETISDLTIAEAVADYIGENPDLQLDETDRITVIGVRGKSIIDMISPQLLLIGCAVLIFFAVITQFKLKNYEKIH